MSKSKPEEFEIEIKNLENNYYENLPCLICNKDNFEIISKTDRYDLYYPTGICVNCENLQQTEYLNDEMLKYSIQNIIIKFI